MLDVTKGNNATPRPGFLKPLQGTRSFFQRYGRHGPLYPVNPNDIDSWVGDESDEGSESGYGTQEDDCVNDEDGDLEV